MNRVRPGWRRIVVVFFAAVACGETEPDCSVPSGAGPRMRFADPAEGLVDFVDHPFPSDALRLADGRTRLSQFPNPTGSDTLQEYLQTFRTQIRGFATSAALYVGFTESMDPASFARDDPGAALASDASVFLVDIDPDSPERGRRYPLRLRYSDASTVYLPEHHLVALPPFGATLLGGTTYALVLTDRLRSAGGAPLVRSAAMDDAVTPACADRAPPSIRRALAPFADWLAEQPDAGRVAGVTVFTTRDAVADIRALADAVRREPPLVASGWTPLPATPLSFRYRATVELPVFQSGERPYLTPDDGGALVRTADGFQVDHREVSRIAVSLPRVESPPAGWPVVLYSHGTGGGFDSVFDMAVSEALAEQGIAAIGYDGTLHGPRDPTGADPQITFFNLFNPVAARDNVVQGAADVVALVEAIETLEVPAAVAGRAGRFDPDRIAFLGHSQGALVGAPFLAANDTVKAVVFSGLGAILTITLLEREDIVDFSALLTNLLRLPEDDPLDDFHPVLNLIQQFIEPADPIAYARSYLADPSGERPASVLMVEGFLDEASPARGQEAFSVAAGLPIVEPAFRRPEAAEWLGPEPTPAPARLNVETPRGSTTYGLIQYPNESHFPIFRNADANRRYVEFIRSALLEGTPVITGPR